MYVQHVNVYLCVCVTAHRLPTGGHAAEPGEGIGAEEQGAGRGAATGGGGKRTSHTHDNLTLLEAALHLQVSRGDTSLASQRVVYRVST